MPETKPKKGKIQKRASKKKPGTPCAPKKEGPIPPTLKKKYRRRLSTLPSLKAYLAQLIHQTREGTVEPSLASKLGFLINILRSIMADSELEMRLAKLEKEVAKKEHGH